MFMMSSWQVYLVMNQDQIEKVRVFYGPSNKIEEKFNLKATPHTSLMEFVADLDAFRVKGGGAADSIFENDTLIVWPEELYGVKETFVHSFWSQILRTNIREVRIVNPPKASIDQAYRAGLDIESHMHEYGSVDMDLVQKISEKLESSIIGQADAIQSIVRCLTTATRTDKKPVVCMLYGPTGVGKTESAKIISSELGGDAMRVQFSMLQTNSLAEYLYGSRTNNSSLAADLLQRQSNLVIFDEFDKTSSTFHSAFYQIFDEGLYVDKNYSVDMSGSIIICTSNYSSPQEIRKHLGEALSSRFTDFIEFKQLADDSKSIIVDQTIEEVYQSYPEDLHQFIDRDDLKARFASYLSGLDNVREISSRIAIAMADQVYKSSKSRSAEDGVKT